MARLRSNFQAGTLSGSITNSATSISSAAFAALPAVVAPDVLVITLDQAGLGGASEIVRVTAHTALSTSVTVTRGQEGTAARSHASGIAWVHAPTAADFDDVEVDSDVRYVAGWGDDDNDGLSWGSAWKSMHRALDEADVLWPADFTQALQIMVADGAIMDPTNTGYGLWLSTDATNAALPGWHRYRRHQIIGVGAGTTGMWTGRYRVEILNTGSTTNAAYRSLWIDGTGGAARGFYMENISLTQWQNGAWIGYDPAGDLSSDTGSAHTYRNCKFWYSNFYSGSVPLTGIWSMKLGGVDTGHCFNFWFFDCDFLGGANRRNVQQDITSIDAFAVVLESAAYVYFHNPTFELGGGVWLESVPGDDPTDFYIHGALQEGDFTFDGTPLLRVLGFTSLTSKVLAVFCDSADTGGSEGAYKLDESGFVNDNVTIISSVIRGFVRGPHISIGNYNGYSNYDSSLLKQGAVGFERGRVVAAHGGPSRAVPGAAVTEVNVASPDITGAYFDNGGIASTVGASGFRDPHGAAAHRITPAAGAGSNTAIRARDIVAGMTFDNGGHIVWGVWQLLVGPGGDVPSVPFFQTLGTSGVTLTHHTVAAPTGVPGVWNWITGYVGVAFTSGDNVGDLRLNLPAKRVGGVAMLTEYSRPTVLYVSSGSGVGVEEVRAMAEYLNPVPFGAPASSFSLLAGVKGLFPAGIGVGNSAAATTPGTVVKKVQIFDAAGASLGYVPVYSSIT